MQNLVVLDPGKSLGLAVRRDVFRLVGGFLAAVGNREDTGLIKVCSSPLYPGSGAKKQLGSIGDVSLLGIVAGREEGFPALERVRYSDVYAMACVLKKAILLFLEQRDRLYA